TVMIVDDDPEIHKKIESYHTNTDINVKTVGTSREAIEQLRNDQSILLLLLHTTIPEEEKTGYFPIDPSLTSAQITDTTDKKNFLLKPFDKKQFDDFIISSLKEKNSCSKDII
ncbi:MAG: hypothetical protein R6U21_04945, partial [Thermoplasmatota archaeon]